MDQFCVIRLPVCELLDWTSGPGVRGGDLRVQLPNLWGGILGRHRLGLPGDIALVLSSVLSLSCLTSVIVVPDRQVVYTVLVRSS